MPLKKRIFRSNMTILSAALAALLVVAVLIMAVFEDTLLRDYENMDNAELDGQVSQVEEIMRTDSLSDWEGLEQRLGDYGYELLVLRENRIAYGRKGEKETEILENLDVSTHMEAVSQPELFYHHKTTAVGRYSKEQKAYVMAVRFSDGEWWLRFFKSSFSAFLAAFVLAGTLAIAVLLLLSSLFTRRMVRRITEPLDCLSAGAERIRRGDLTKEIVYRGDGEFEAVCATFNTMQKTMLEDSRQRLKNERERTDMITGISHDLRTPLTSIRGYIKGILDRVADTPEKRRLYLETAYEAAGEMNVLLQKLFDFSRMESGRLPLHMVRADLAEFSDLYTAQKEAALEKDGIVLTLVGERETPGEIWMDVEQMRRIFDNLLENSRKYVREAPVRIRLRIFEKDQDVVAEWSDNGPGVPEEKLERIFERFYRCDESRREKGSGIGLYVVKYLAEQQGGSISARNEGGLLIQMRFPEADRRKVRDEDTDCRR